MPLFHWSDKYKLDIQSIDDQHKQLFAIMNEVHEIVTADSESDDVNNSVKKLLQYTKDHLNFEESLLQKHEYPDYDAHKIQHEGFCNQIGKYRALLDNNEKIDPLDLLSFTIEWLGTHILETDFKYRDFLKEKGVD